MLSFSDHFRPERERMGWSALITAGIDFDLGALPEVERSPVYVRHLAEVDRLFADAVDELQSVRECFARGPDLDAHLDVIMGAFHQKLVATDMAIGRFRCTRDCKGAG